MKATQTAIHTALLAERFDKIGEETRALEVLNQAADKLEATVASMKAEGNGRRTNRMVADVKYLRHEATWMRNRQIERGLS
jgi:hypothetical protein